MYYTNKETFVLSADGCMDTERGGLESILAGNDEGAKGCCFSVAMSSDGIAVLSSDGCVAAHDGTRLPGPRLQLRGTASGGAAADAG